MKTTKKLKRMVAGVLASLMAMSGTANIWAADTEENVHLSMAFWADQSEIDRMDQLLEIWKADHPNVTLDYTYCAGPDYPTKLQVWFSSGKAPDVIRMSRDIFSPFASEDLFADLTPYLEASGSAGCWDESLLDIFDFDGELLSLPYMYSNYVIAYNKDIFDEGNLEYQEGKLVTTKKEKEYHGYGLKSIRYTVNKYDGAVSIDTNGNWFDLKILIPMRDRVI